MARARNIKPGFFLNEELVELPFVARLLFIGLWTIADREGRLEDRPVKIKMALFPADDVDVNKDLELLAVKGFLFRYTVENCKYIQITNFTKHQKPHTNEVESVIPPMEQALAPMVEALGSDSLLPLTDSLTTNGGSFLSGRSGIPKERTPINPSLDLELNTWLDATAVAVGAKNRSGLPSPKQWEAVTMKLLQSNADLGKWLTVVESEKVRCKDTPHFFSADACLKTYQLTNTKKAESKWLH